MRVTLFVPASGYVKTKLVAVVLVVVPFPNVQKRLVIVPRDKSLNVTLNGRVPEVGFPEKEAKGPGGTIAVTFDAELFAGFESAALELTVATLVA